MQSLNFADLDTTTLGKPQKPNIPQEKAMTEETRAYIILSAVAACMGFLLIWWKAMQKVTQNGNVSLPLMDKTIRCDPLQPAVDQPAPKTSASVYAKQCLIVGENSVISMKRIRKRLGISGRDGKLTKLIRPRGKR
jgi:hypothetical protein